MSELGFLRRRLMRLARLRWFVQLLHALLLAVATLVVVVTLLFLFDWSLDLAPSARVVTGLALFAGAAWLLARKIRRHWIPRESLIHMALVVERERGIDSDLVAALQFDESPTANGGSPELAHVVRSYVAEAAEQIDLRGLIPARRLAPPAAVALPLLAAMIAAATLFPAYARPFWNRLLLAEAYYPTHTIIDSLSIQGTLVSRSAPPAAEVELPIDVTRRSQRPAVTVVSDSPLRIAVQSRGTPPDGGTLIVTDSHGENRVEYPLSPVEGRSGRSAGIFTASVPSLEEDAHVQVQLGDAHFPGLEIHTVARPVVRLQFTPAPPSYAAAEFHERQQRRSPYARSVSALEGSRVDVELHSLTGPLQQATLFLDDRPVPLRKPSSPAGATETWVPREAVPELMALNKSIPYRVSVVDEYGLEPASAPQGVLQMLPDHAPGGDLSIITTYVLPSGAPTVDYRAWDEFGIAKVSAILKVDDRRGEKPARVTLYERGDRPAQRQVAGEYRLDLAPLNLKPGQRLKVALEIIDERGSAPGVAVTTTEEVLEVTDRDGLMSKLLEIDRQSANTLDRIIEQELGVGDTQ